LVCFSDGVYVPSQGSEGVSPRKMGKENSFDGKTDADLNSQKSVTNCNEKKPKKTKREGLKEMCNGSRDEGAHPNRSSLIKPTVSEDISKKEVQINGKASSVLSKKKNSKKWFQIMFLLVPLNPKIRRMLKLSKMQECRML
jgi:hypothetical protein